MQRSQRHSHCWKHCLKSSTEMLSRAASDSRWTSATSTKAPFWLTTKWWLFPPSPPPLSRSRSLRFFFFFGSQGWIRTWNGRSFFDVVGIQRESLAPLTAIPLKILDNVSSRGEALGSLHPVKGGVLWRGLEFQTCTTILNNFLTNPGKFWSPSYDTVYWSVRLRLTVPSVK